MTDVDTATGDPRHYASLAPSTVPDAGAGAAEAAVQDAWRTQRVAVLASVARRLGDLQNAEDAVQEAFAAAAVRWPIDGVPERPGAWLTTTAWRKALDALRRDRFPVQDDRGVVGITDTAPPDRLAGDLDGAPVDDDVLSLVLTCCHPALSAEAQIALTLRHVAGLSDAQIAARFLVPAATMTKRLVRARAKIRDAKISFELPDRTRLADRLSQIHAVIYLIFTEGYLSSDDSEVIRRELCDEGVWLARQLHELVPDDLETIGLLALLLLHNARAAARQDLAGGLVPYDEQDRTLWDRAAVAEAKSLLAATGHSPPGAYQLESAVALLHATASSSAALDWSTIAALHAARARIAPSPVVDVNLAVAVGRSQGPVFGLAVLQRALADPRLTRYLPLHAAQADLLERAGDPAAAGAWERAAGLAEGQAQREQLQRRADRLRR